MKRLIIYIEQRLAILRCNDDYELTIKGNDNDSITVNYRSDDGAWQKEYNTLRDLLLDNELSETWKWIARGLLGVPLCEIKKEAGS